jgi:hypothetical protein
MKLAQPLQLEHTAAERLNVILKDHAESARVQRFPCFNDPSLILLEKILMSQYC